MLAWPLTAFVVSVVYCAVAGMELGLAQRAMESSSHGDETQRETETEERESRGGHEKE
ncbi:hypothetical protein ABZ281_44915 [Streptomyces sp. NPDC006265]|uniref:hypothetical protein n=1 Tax=Streptomyces sp. NPDC006265 TaxID=3156740 RepID=UPI0033B7FEE1